jgi:AraC-like DNA-binding protein
MKPIYEKLVRFREDGIALKALRGKSLSCPWHFHSEYELILVQESSGYRIVGDNVAAIQPNDLVLIGPNLPHIYQYDRPFSGDNVTPRGILIQFEERWWSSLLELPALNGVRRLLHRAVLGLHVTGRTRDQAAALMTKMVGYRGLRRITAFLSLMEILARSRTCLPLSSPGFAVAPNPYDEKRVNRVWQFINEHLDQPLSLPAAARLLHMSDGAFSRFFRAHLGKTFPEFVNELRIGRACRLLAETQDAITQIALACGYRNLSNFNRQFARFKKCTPRAFWQRLVRKVSETVAKGAADPAGGGCNGG